jgi:hypothetical protein
VLSLTEALAALPGTADAIAAHLAAKGIRGVRNSDKCCPIANYLTGAGFSCVSVGGTSAFARDDRQDYWEWTTDAVAGLVERFDAGEWPELVADAETDTEEKTA